MPRRWTYERCGRFHTRLCLNQVAERMYATIMPRGHTLSPAVRGVQGQPRSAADEAAAKFLQGINGKLLVAAGVRLYRKRFPDDNSGLAVFASGFYITWPALGLVQPQLLEQDHKCWKSAARIIMGCEGWEEVSAASCLAT